MTDAALTPTEKLAAELRSIAASVTSTNYAAESLRGAQLARRLDREGAEQLWKLSHEPDYGRPDLRVRAVLEGVAIAAVIDGVSSTGVSPYSVVNINTAANASSLAFASTSAHIQLDALLARPEMPEEARKEVEALRAAVVKGEDKPSLLERAGRIASKLKEFPLLVAALTEAVKAFL